MLAPKLQKVSALRDFPVDQIPLLCMDIQTYIQKPRLTFEDEPFFVAGVMRGLSTMLDGVGTKKLKGNYFRKLHDICLKDTYILRDGKKTPGVLGYKPLSSDKGCSGFPIIEGLNYSQAGHEELK